MSCFYTTTTGSTGNVETTGYVVSTGYFPQGVAIESETDDVLPLAVGLGVGALAVCVLCALMVVLLLKRRKKKRDSSQRPESIEMHSTESFTAYAAGPLAPASTSYSGIPVASTAMKNSSSLGAPIGDKETSKYSIKYEDLIYQRGTDNHPCFK